MPRIQALTQSNDPATSTLLNTVKQKKGKVPNIVATMANSVAVANAYLGFSQALATGSLSARLREQIALVVGQNNGCNYCLAAHTAIGKSAGLSENETQEARKGKSTDPKVEVALRFAGDMIERRGNMSDEQLQSLRQAGYSEGEITEIVANVAINIFTNYFNHVADTDIDFPLAPAL